MKPSVSVIVPVYNVEPYLRRCLDSILAQTFQDFELIIVDDGSTDGCGAICDEYASSDARVRVIHKKNAGVSTARNTGLDAAIGQYVYFCDSDDSILPETLQSTVMLAEENSADAVSFNFSRGEKKQNLDGSVSVVDLSGIDTRYEYLFGKPLFHNGCWEVWTFLFTRSVIEENNIRFCLECNNYAEDLGFTLNYLMFGTKLVEFNKELYCYDDSRAESMMHRSRNTIRLNEVNEVSRSLEKAYDSVFAGTVYEDSFCRIHYNIIRDQAGRLMLDYKISSFIADDWNNVFSHVVHNAFFIEQNRKNLQKCRWQNFQKHGLFGGWRENIANRFLINRRPSYFIFNMSLWEMLHFPAKLIRKTLDRS